MTTLILDADAIPDSSHHQILLASRVELSLTRPPKLFYRHGWQSWTLTSWLDPATPPLPIREPQFRAKDEDPAYALHKNHVSAWVAAVELQEDDILLIGALELSGRIELNDYTLNGFYEDGHEGEWLIARGKEEDVFSKYTALLEAMFGKTRYQKPPRVWCSWYSLLKWINEPILTKVLQGLADLPFDVFQLDDGWQLAHGDWEPNNKFPGGMEKIAEKIRSTGRTAGIWLAPFMVSPASKLAANKPGWILRDENGQPVPAGITWGGNPWALDLTHPEVLEWLDKLICQVVGWGYNYLKLDFLYAGATVGKRYQDLPREVAYRNGMEIVRKAAGDAYILACGAPIIPSLGLCDGIRVGPDAASFWLNKPLSVWLNNPNEPSAQNAIRTSLHRLWLKPLVNVDPDVVYFRSKYIDIKPKERQLLEDLCALAGFKATSDLPQWWSRSERVKVREFLEADPGVQKKARYVFQIDGRDVDFSPAIPIPASDIDIPVWLAKNWGLLKIVRLQVLPALIETGFSR